MPWKLDNLLLNCQLIEKTAICTVLFHNNPRGKQGGSIIPAFECSWDREQSEFEKQGFFGV